VKVLEDHDDRLAPEQEVLDGVERALPALAGSSACQRASSTGTARRDKRADRVGSRARSSVRSLPVTFSRMARGSSRSVILKHPLRRLTTGRYGAVLPYEAEPASRINQL
jgi:hypothetical protein